MPYSLYISAEGAAAQSRRMETIANNLANVDTVGFKRDLAVQQARFAEETAQGLDQPGTRTVNDLGGGVMTPATLTDFSHGPMKNTTIPTDMAIEGPGFFVVSDGERELLTRAGNFSLTATGDLVTQQGYAVLNSSGQPVRVPPDQGPWQITSDGSVFQAGNATPLAIVEPDSLLQLQKVGENSFLPLEPAKPVSPLERRVAQGYLEGSTVAATTEMMEMIQTSRAFEANVNLIRHQDQMLGTLIGRLLKAG